MNRTSRRPLAWLMAVGLLFLLAACGSDSTTDETASGALADGDQVDVEMSSFAYDPAEFTVASGATVTFVLNNTDSIDHEALIGDMAAQDAHESEMTSGGGMGDGDTTHTTEMGGHKSAASDPSGAVSVAPGESAELTYTFDEAGTFIMGCHESGHFDGGMKATITVT